MNSTPVGFALGTIPLKITSEQINKANRALQYAQQNRLAKIRKQRKRRK